MATDEATLIAEALEQEEMPSELSWPQVRRRVAFLVLVIAAIVVIVALLPGLDSIRDRFANAQLSWLLVGAALQVGSCLSYVFIFRAVFCRLMSWRTSYEIGTAELATNSLISVGGAGGLALGAWILRRGGMTADRIARRTVAFFLLTSLANVTALIVAGLAIAVGLVGTSNKLLGLVPAAIGVAGIVLALLIRPLAHALAERTERPKVAAGLEHVAIGVDEALSLLRRGDPPIILGAAGYMLFDVAMLGVCFSAFGNDVPAVGILLMAYLIGQLGGLIPIPGGIGGVDGGLIGTLVLYGSGTTAAITAVLAYRGLVLLIPVAMGIPSMLSLQRRLRRETHDIWACSPEGEITELPRS